MSLRKFSGTISTRGREVDGVLGEMATEYSLLTCDVVAQVEELGVLTRLPVVITEEGYSTGVLGSRIAALDESLPFAFN